MLTLTLRASVVQAAGKGTEDMASYERCRLRFMDIPNIHVVRRSLAALADLCTSSDADDVRWWGKVDASGWVHHLHFILKAAVRGDS